MSSIIQAKGYEGSHAITKGDVTVYVTRNIPNAGGALNAIGIIKNISFNISKPKTPIYVLSRSNPVGFAKDPEDRTFSMGALHTFENIEDISYFTNSIDPFIIRIVHLDMTKLNGEPVVDENGVVLSKMKIMQLDGVEFEGNDYNVDANTSEYVFNFNGRFTGGFITGDINGDFDPVTGIPGSVSVLPF